MSCNSDSLGTYSPTGRTFSDERWPDPFCDAASTAMPTSIQEALRWCEFLAIKNGVYREALRRIISYFITDIEIEEQPDNRISHEERQKYEAFLEDTIGIKNILHIVALDYIVYGNSFTSLLMPFRRYLSCQTKGCGFEAPLAKIYDNPQYRFKWTDYEFHATCPKCKCAGKWKHIDRRSGESGEIRVKRWSPHDIDIIWDPYSDTCTYVWRIPEEYRTLIRQGHLHVLETASWEVVQAVKENKNLKFDKDVVYHMREYALAGMRNRGWGISRVLSNFGIAWYLQVLWRFNEAIALDYVVPFRVLTPEQRAGGTESFDPVHSINLAGFTSRVNAMLRAHRKDPARWNVLPFSLKYNALGGEATSLAPKELIDQALDTLLSAIGVPVEFYKGTMSVQAAPAALRLFEATWSHLVHNLNVFLQRLAEQTSRMMSWEPVRVKLQRVTHADDLNRQMAKLQLMMGNQISKTTGLSSVGIDHPTETRRMFEEARFEADEQKRIQESMEQEAQTDELMKTLAPSPVQQIASQLGAQGGAPGAAPGGASGGQMTAVDQFIMQRQNQPNVPTTPDELQAQAQGIAEQMMTMPDAQRKGELAKLRKSDTTIHQLVLSILDEKRRQVKSDAGQQAMQQMQQQPKQASFVGRVRSITQYPLPNA